MKIEKRKNEKKQDEELQDRTRCIKKEHNDNWFMWRFHEYIAKTDLL